PEDMIKRNRVLDTVKRIFESYGYAPLETPAFESLEMLKLKSGEDIIDQIYYFKDKSGRELGLRFEMTVSMARVVASRRDLQLPFKRYAIGPVWRYERPGAGRLREFYQADVDIVGTDDPLSDAEVISVAVACLRALGFEDFQIRINDRRILEGFMEIVEISKEKSLDVLRALDKLDKIGRGGVEESLEAMGIDREEAGRLLEFTDLKGSPEAVLEEVRRLLSGREAYLIGCESLEGIVEYAELLGFSQYLMVDLSLARGLDYYTGPVFEIGLSGEEVGSVAGGGRYDQLIELYGGRPTPATGISLGIERIMTLLEQRGFFEPVKTRTQVFVAYTSTSLRKEAIRIAGRLREAGLRVDMDLMGRNLSNQLEYVDKKGIGLAVIVGERELGEGCVALRDMRKEEQTNVSLEDLAEEVRARLPADS
ncbi:MAG: histidine--tRNA ligase, partial [Candidatus Bathyarchaeia archaeon]